MVPRRRRPRAQIAAAKEAAAKSTARIAELQAELKALQVEKVRLLRRPLTRARARAGVRAVEARAADSRRRRHAREPQTRVGQITIDEIEKSEPELVKRVDEDIKKDNWW